MDPASQVGTVLGHGGLIMVYGVFNGTVGMFGACTNLPLIEGKDDGQMISRLSDWGKKSLLEIFNLSWRLGRLPRDWKKALIIPIRKSSKKACYPESFRPIALTNFSCKLMERLFLSDLLTI
ncbi:putative RNA-directed DNA polymerase from transposon BS [Trichonephila clavipes]|nr:putative RNA-directed DNA polymerase from transposon BS [Trichonephila clavipes]